MKKVLHSSKRKLEEAKMPSYKVILTKDEQKQLEELIQKGGKGYRIRHAQILMKLDKTIPGNENWNYDKIREAYGSSHATIAGVARRFVLKGMEAALGRKKQENRHRKITGEVEAQICMIACSEPPDGRSHWTMKMIADRLIELEVVEYISDTAVCNAMKKMRLNRGFHNNGVFQKPVQNS